MTEKVSSATRAHGTRVKYVVEGCRCLPCKAANSRYSCELARRHGRYGHPYKVFYSPAANHFGLKEVESGEIIARGDRGLIYEMYGELISLPESMWAGGRLIGQVREHLKELEARGVGLRRVSMICGVSRSRLQEIRDGIAHRKGRPARRRLKKETAERIPGVLGYDCEGGYVPAQPIWEMVSCLKRSGISKARISRALGNKTPALQLSRRQVWKKNADKIRALHDAAWRFSAELRRECACSHQLAVAR